jgi:hypothetical protein
VRFKNFDQPILEIEKMINHDDNNTKQERLIGGNKSMLRFPAHGHFEVKHTSYHMTTHCSRVDESFTDFIFQPVRCRRGSVFGLRPQTGKKENV